MANDIKEFLDATKTTIAAISGINSTFIAAAFDPTAALRVPRFPMAIINDGGGSLNEYNGQLWTRTLEVTLVVNQPRDHIGERAYRELLDVGDALVTALEYSNTNGIYLASDSDVQADPVTTGVILVTKTYAFQYQIDRST